MECRLHGLLLHPLSEIGRAAGRGSGLLSSKFIFTGSVPIRSRTSIRSARSFRRIAEIQLHASDDGRYILASMANGDGGEFAHYLLGPSGQWHQIARLSDEISSAKFSPDGNLYFLSHLNAPKGKILRASLAKPLVADAQMVVPEGKTTIARFRAGGECSLH